MIRRQTLCGTATPENRPPLPLPIGDALIGFQNDFKWNDHIEETTRKASK
jgi:hypothetical protein